MRNKHLLTLKQSKDQPPWTHIAVYWLGKDIYNYNKEFHHPKKQYYKNKQNATLLLPGLGPLYQNT